MIRRPGSQAIHKLYRIGLDTPELQTVPDQPFVDDIEFERMTGDIFWAAYADGQPVGFVHAVLWNGHGCVVYLAVAVAYRGRGWGRKLVQKALSELKRQGARNVYAWVRHGSQANALVDRLGFFRGGDFTYVFRGPG